jgi:hypothetical protein
MVGSGSRIKHPGSATLYDRVQIAVNSVTLTDLCSRISSTVSGVRSIVSRLAEAFSSAPDPGYRNKLFFFLIAKQNLFFDQNFLPDN